ncbi:OsmC family protein [Geothrix sp. PMB-07]|uniref:OsmC family protein n=1 Tax=Geothrix sp. PMB-07 TaxID=3068640 RepID=UPI0027429295|nr:OsmC family protein [Geothrix sp. PMB-07]WLT32535.1 OsmC family protein [Geothrix sp. PMB-07]
MTATSTVSWDSGLAFQAEQDGHRFMLDASAEADGRNLGPRPKALLLSALGACTGIDVVSILEKMRVKLDGLQVQVSAEMREEHPRIYTGIHVRYVFRGRDLPMDKLERAVQLSEDTYCGVSAMLRPAVPITSEIVVEG